MGGCVLWVCCGRHCCGCSHHVYRFASLQPAVCGMNSKRPCCCPASCCWWCLLVPFSILPTPATSLSPPLIFNCPQEWEFLLEELALYLLMYSEGANLRHTPEASAGQWTREGLEGTGRRCWGGACQPRAEWRCRDSQPLVRRRHWACRWRHCASRQWPHITPLPCRWPYTAGALVPLLVPAQLARAADADHVAPAHREELGGLHRCAAGLCCGQCVASGAAHSWQAGGWHAGNCLLLGRCCPASDPTGLLRWCHPCHSWSRLVSQQNFATQPTTRSWPWTS